MILRRYGASVQSVDLNFDSRALTEIGFRRNQEGAQPADAFRDGYERLRERELLADAEGFVQDDVKRELLSDLEAQVVRLESELGAGEVLFVENEQGVDHPKTRTQTRTSWSMERTACTSRMPCGPRSVWVSTAGGVRQCEPRRPSG